MLSTKKLSIHSVFGAVISLASSSLFKEALSSETREAMSCRVSSAGFEVLIAAMLKENTWRESG